MANDVIIPAANLPADLASELLGDTEDLVTSGAGFPVLSIRGSKFRVKVNGEETPLLDRATGDPLASLQLVIVKASPNISRIYYDEAYKEGDDNPPVCGSADGIAPDSGVDKPQSSTCATCPHAVWGSLITQQGTKTTACSSSKRLVVTFASNMDNEELGGPMLLRVPAGSFKGLTRLANELKGIGHGQSTVVVRFGFDISASYPKLEFRAIAALDNAQLHKVVELRKHENTQAILELADSAIDKPKAPPVKKPEPESLVAFGSEEIVDVVVGTAPITAPKIEEPEPEPEPEPVVEVQEKKEEVVEKKKANLKVMPKPPFPPKEYEDHHYDEVETLMGTKELNDLEKEEQDRLAMRQVSDKLGTNVDFGFDI